MHTIIYRCKTTKIFTTAHEHTHAHTHTQEKKSMK